MKMIRVFVAGFLLFSFCTQPLIAQPPSYEVSPSSIHCGICEGAESENWARSAPGKIVRGLVNAGLGWTNLFAQPKAALSGGGNVASGIAKGFGYTLLRTVQGVVELGIFWLPPAYGEPLKNCALGDLGATGR